MVGRERLLNAVGSQLTLGKHSAGVVEQHIDLVVREVDVPGELANLFLRGQVGDEQLGWRAGRSLSDPGVGLLTAVRVAADHHDLGPRFGEPRGGDESDAPVGTGHSNDLVVHVNHVVLRICRC